MPMKRKKSSMTRLLTSLFFVRSSSRFYNVSSFPTFSVTTKTRPTFGHKICCRQCSAVPIATIGDSDEMRPKETSDNKFEVTSPYEPTGDQPEAIARLVQQIARNGDKFSVLRGATGTGKTMVMAHTIARLGKPTLVLCHNKTLAAQLARELRACLSKNHVQLFVSYYNTYVPESFNEVTNKYTAKKSSINDELDALRHLATRALVQHKDVVIVASVSCIYGLGMPKSYLEASLKWVAGETTFDSVEEVTEAMRTTVYTPSSESGDDLARGEYHLSYNSTGATLAVWPPAEAFPMRVDFELDGDESLRVSSLYQGYYKGLKSVDDITIFPAKHHLTESAEQFEEALDRIQTEMQERVQYLKAEGKAQEADRLAQRVSQDLQLLRETGTCSGVENYSRHMALREAGQPPDTLLDYFGSDDWMLIVDESHVTLSQLKAMYAGDRSRKERLVKHGYRLPSALDNRPLKESEFWDRISQALFVTATPSQQELSLISGLNEPVDMVIRPTFVCDPIVEVRPIENQLDNLLQEIQTRAQRGERTLAMALTKRDAEDLAAYLDDHGVLADYIHSGLTTHERSNALKSLQSGTIDCLVGVNLLREGLDLPQVSLVAILNADSEGFLRSETALLQTIGRAARNMNGAAVLYANRVTESMRKCIAATQHRRRIQLEYNAKHGKEMRSTEGSSVLSIFDLLKDQIEAEHPIEVIKPEHRIPSNFQALEEPSKMTMISSGIDVKEDEIVTDHIPSKPGVYFWKDSDGKVLYIGKAKRLRSRVKSYLSPKANHSTRIRAMLKRAARVDFILTPSDRDAILLESNLIKHHQPTYNVLLKDDASYPYILASIGDEFPQLSIVPRRQESTKASSHKYFGPYPHYSEINSILQEIEEHYDLRATRFKARFGEASKAQYQRLFQKVVKEVFLNLGGQDGDQTAISTLRSKYEEGTKLFESKYNVCRDVVGLGRSQQDEKNQYVVQVLQLRDGLVAGQFSYPLSIESEMLSEQDYGDAIQCVLDQLHYPSGGEKGRFTFFPDEILTQFPITNSLALIETIRAARNAIEPERKSARISIRTLATRGPKREADERALRCAIDNAEQAADEYLLAHLPGVCKAFVDGTAAADLGNLLALEKVPRTIECYDISHTQGGGTVASRVVFVDGSPKRSLYRRFNIKTVTGVDDYASLREVMERRFRRASSKSCDNKLVDGMDPWALPDLVVIDGGKGQLTAALKGMASAGVYPLVRTGFEPDETQVEVSSDAFIVEETHELTPSLIGNRILLPVIALAKNKEEVFTVGNAVPVNQRPDSPGVLLLRSLRDESHRFALGSHRKRRSKANGI